MNILNHTSGGLETIFGLKYLIKTIADPDPGIFLILDPGWKNSDPDPQQGSTPKFFQVDEVICEPLEFSRTPHIVQAQLCHLTREKTAFSQHKYIRCRFQIRIRKAIGIFSDKKWA
jgi:hypothetical protein